MELTPRQQKVFQILSAKGEALKLGELARKAFPGVRPIIKANSWVRNQLRGLVRAKLAKRVGRGTYQAIQRSPSTAN
jgi:hypothetical protein